MARKLLAEDVGVEIVAYVKTIGDIEDKAIAASYWVRVGRWYDKKLRHLDYAVASYREAIKLQPTLGEAYDGLAHVLRKQQRWADLAESLAAHLDIETDEQKLISLYLAAGELYETQLASNQKAIEFYDMAAELEARSGELARLPGRGRLQRRMFDELVAHGRRPDAAQRDLAWRVYLENLEEERLLSAFRVESLERVGRGAERGWLYGFTTYDRGLNTAQQVAEREGLPAATIFRMLDAEQENPDTIKRYLERAALKAGQEGQVVMIGHSYPDTVTAVFSWALDAGSQTVRFAPLSAILRN